MRSAVVALLSIAGACGHAQLTNGFEWERTFGGTNADFACVAGPATDGGFILGGYSFSEVSGSKTSAHFGGGDFWVLKLDTSGGKVWERSWGGAELDRINDLQQTSDGGFILGGTSFSDVSGNKTSGRFGGGDFWLVKIDSNGNKQWDKTFGGTDRDELRVVKQTTDGGFLVAGISFSAASGNKSAASFGTNAPDYWVLKLDSSGNKQWDKAFGGADADELQAAQQTSDGGFILGGHSFSGVSGNKMSPGFGTNTSDLWLVKTDSAGNKLWDRSYGGTDSEQLASVQVLSDGGFLVGGSSYSGASGNKTSASFGSHDFWILKLNSAGAMQWDQAFGGSDADELHSALPASDGGFVLSGMSYSGVSGSKTSRSSVAGAGDYWIVKLAASGAQEWEQSVRGTLSGELLRLQLTANGSYVVPGLTTTNALPAPDYALVKLLMPLRFNAQSFSSAGVFRGTLNAINGTNYILESTTNFTHWTAVQTNQGSNSAVTFVHTNGTGSPRRFYRARR